MEWQAFILAVMVMVVDMKTLEPENQIEKRAVVCYDNYGCFASEGPFGISAERPLVLTPQSPDKVGVVFKLYTREYKTTSQDLQAIHVSNAATTLSHFKARPTKILVHGFLDNPALTSWQKDLKDQYLKFADYNVIIVDWSKGNLPPYTQATANTRIVGAGIALLVKELIKSKGVTAADFHIIGHSLGSHISGYAGERIPGLGRITGLDPAGPYFENTDPVVRLDPSDAVFVDAIHSDGEKNLIPVVTFVHLGLGMKQAVGHLDFYPNLGRDQPGCTRNPFTNIAEWGLIQGTTEVVACNHFRSVHFFIESVNSPCPFMGYVCNNEADFSSGKCNECGVTGCAFMGAHADRSIPPRNTHRHVYMSTASHQPFCQFHMDITVKLSSGTGQIERGQLSAVFTGEKGTTTKIQLNSSPIDFNIGSVHHFNVATPSDIGNIRSVTLSFNHVAPLLNPFQWNLLGLRDPKLYIDEIDVDRQEANVKSRLCGSGITVETDKSIVLNKSC
ncbi:unnamed protein product [Lymnaea stagnalis]|uniref:Lipase domain-containing protein n=1 Tax=Lymnaea stagnalis TaxID=6523 RepID=A0AAV2HXB7_LYMST